MHTGSAGHDPLTSTPAYDARADALAAVAQGAARGEPDPVAKDCSGKPVVFVTLGVGVRGHVALPILVCNGSWRGHRRGDYVMAQAGWSTS